MIKKEREKEVKERERERGLEREGGEKEKKREGERKRARDDKERERREKVKQRGEREERKEKERERGDKEKREKTEGDRVGDDVCTHCSWVMDTAPPLDQLKCVLIGWHSSLLTDATDALELDVYLTFGTPPPPPPLVLCHQIDWDSIPGVGEAEVPLGTHPEVPSAYTEVPSAYTEVPSAYTEVPSAYTECPDRLRLSAGAWLVLVLVLLEVQAECRGLAGVGVSSSGVLVGSSCGAPNGHEAPEEASCTDPIVLGAAKQAMDQINKDRTEGYVYHLRDLANAHILKHGENSEMFYLTMNVLETNCSVLHKAHDCEVRDTASVPVYGQCKVAIFISRVHRVVRLYKYNCVVRPVPPEKIHEVCPDCPVLVDKNSEQVQQTITKTLEKFNKESGLHHYFSLLHVNRARLSHKGFCVGSHYKPPTPGEEEVFNVKCEIFEPEVGHIACVLKILPHSDLESLTSRSHSVTVRGSGVANVTLTFSNCTWIWSG
ncbi:hypothetical protein WMY93_024574 [Mugilogobius chulae]|uniref:Cystatin domain-containing protein n=1 Tax=Mugilogobius chulae TaxID=88201 RepID=A0AAW0N4E9_9GOBI